MYNTQNIEGLGVVATGKRRIFEGRQYYGMFPEPIGSDPIVNSNAEVHDTLNFVAKVVKETLRDTKKVAAALKKGNNLATSRSIFDFFYKHYAYKLDKYGVEQVRRPARSWKDRKSGIDCDCFTTSVSSILTNLGIEHYLKIIAINNRPNFQHIYVIVPKFTNADITKRGNYWVIDPVLNRFDEEAPNITKTDHLKMEGIPLQYLNGIDPEVAGLGREFDQLEESLSGIDDMEGVGFAHFRRAMHSHVKNTRRKIQKSPSSVDVIYEPAALAGLFGEMESAFEGTTDDELIQRLEGIAKREHSVIKPRFRHVANAIHMHDNHVYGAMFGDIDDQMISAVSGLGKKGRSAKKQAKANKKSTTGPATKVKNALKKAKQVTKAAGAKTKAAVKSTASKAKVVAKNTAAKTKTNLKKIGKQVVKNNPVSLAARAGFLLAMRTNFAFIAERAYWGYQTKAFATSRGITPEYYDRCLQLLNKIRKTFIGVLKGDESALKLAIVNGRAAKRIALQLKNNGMSGVENLMGFGSVEGLGAVSAATITAATSFITPIVNAMQKLFSGVSMFVKRKRNKNGTPVEQGVRNENGTTSEGPSDSTTENMNETVREASSPSNTIIQNDGSVETANKVNEAAASEEGDSSASASRSMPPGSTSANTSEVTSEGNNSEEGSSSSRSVGTETKSKSKTGLILGAGALAAIAFAMAGKKKDKKSLSGVGNFSSKRESKNLKKKLAKKGIKLPHGYKVEKREKLKTVKL